MPALPCPVCDNVNPHCLTIYRQMKSFHFSARLELLSAATLVCLLALSVPAQQAALAGPVVVQPARRASLLKAAVLDQAKLPPHSPADVQFMQGMIMHHAQAVEMTDLIESRTRIRNFARSDRESAGRRQTNEFYETLVDGERRTTFAADAAHAGHGPLESPDADARNAQRQADGSVKKRKGPGV